MVPAVRQSIVPFRPEKTLLLMNTVVTYTVRYNAMVFTFAMHIYPQFSLYLPRELQTSLQVLSYKDGRQVCGAAPHAVDFDTTIVRYHRTDV